MINLDKALNLALLNKVCAIVKTYVDNKISALATSLQDILEDVDAEIDNKVIAFRNVSDTASNAVYIYAKQKPVASITLLTIECRKAVTK